MLSPPRWEASATFRTGAEAADDEDVSACVVDEEDDVAAAGGAATAPGGGEIDIGRTGGGTVDAGVDATGAADGTSTHKPGGADSFTVGGVEEVDNAASGAADVEVADVAAAPFFAPI